MQTPSASSRYGFPVLLDHHRQSLPPGRARRCAGRWKGWDLAAIDVLFIENVGNLVCPTSYDLGEARKIVAAERLPKAKKSRLSIPASFSNRS